MEKIIVVADKIERYGHYVFQQRNWDKANKTCVELGNICKENIQKSLQELAPTLSHMSHIFVYMIHENTRIWIHENI